MKINLHENDKLELEKLFAAYDDNLKTSEYQNEFLTEYFDKITKNDIDLMKDEEGIEEKDAYRMFFLSILDLDSDDPEVSSLIEEANFGSFDRLDKKIVTEIGYYGSLIKKDFRSGNISLSTNYYSPYEGFVYDEIKGSGRYYREETPLGYFTDKVEYPVIMDHDEVWMSITPHEIRTMARPIEKATGHVLALGLGLGYFAYMASEKESVESITIVENDERMIRLFIHNLLPLFPHKEKISIVNADAFRYFKNAKDYDYCFIDIWHGVEDGLPQYMEFKRLSQHSSIKNIDYWIEESIITYLRRFAVTLLIENTEGYTDSDYSNGPETESRILYALYTQVKNRTFNTYDEIYEFLSDDNLKALVSSSHLRMN